MGRPREPIQLIQAKGATHLTKREIEDRLSREPQPCTDEIAAPAFLSVKLKKRFDKLASQLCKLNLMGETDVDTLARYVVAQEAYEQAVKSLAQINKDTPKRANYDEDEAYYNVYNLWFSLVDCADRRVDKYFKQAQSAASALGLTISSRCKLQVPIKEEQPKVNKFAAFVETEAVDEA